MRESQLIEEGMKVDMAGAERGIFKKESSVLMVLLFNAMDKNEREKRESVPFKSSLKAQNRRFNASQVFPEAN